MNTFKGAWATLALLTGLLTTALHGQTLNAEFSGAPQALINEAATFSLRLTNSGNPGFQPYLRVLLPPEMPAASLQATFMGQEVQANQITAVGTFGGSLNDPNLAEDDPNSPVTGQAGYSLVIVNIPVGALADTGLEIEMTLSGTLTGPGTQLYTPVTLYAQPLYRYGNSATGENGSLMFPQLEATVEPIPYRAKISRVPGEIVGGNCTPVEFTLGVDIASNQLITGLNISAQLPSGIGYGALIASTPGCIVQQQPSPGNSGNFVMQCNNVMGSALPIDVSAVFSAEATIGPDLAGCDSLVIATNVTLTSNQGQPVANALPLTLYHMTFEPVVESEVIAPGETITLGMVWQASEFVQSLEGLSLDLLLPDGLTYAGNPQLNGAPFSNMSSAPVGGGQTALHFNVHAENPTIGPCDAGLITFDATINEHFTDGVVVAARDRLFAIGGVSFTLSGQDPCVRPFSTGFTVPAPSFTKEVVNTPANGVKYTAGEHVVYRLTLTSDGVAINDAVFEDLFPIPVHNVADLNLSFGASITHSLIDNQGLVPQLITIDAPQNRLRIEWGDIPASVPGVPAVVSVDISMPVSGSPFAPFLRHTNFARLRSVNSVAEASSSLSFTTIEVGAPQLLVYKGVLAVDNPAATLTPFDPSLFLVANAQHVDAFDWVTFRTTLRNIGDAPAHGVIVNYFPPADVLHQCSVDGVTLANGTSVPSSGDLYTAGLVVQSVHPGISNRVYVQHKCRVRSTAQARRSFENTSQAAWASVAGGANYFSPVSDACNVSIARPSAEINVLAIQPGHGDADEVHIGELVTFEAAFRVPEGITTSALLEIDLPQGLAVEQILEFPSVPQVSFANGGFITMFNNIQVTSIGAGTENQRRRISLNTGSITNANTVNSVSEVLRLRFTATVLNSAANQSGQALNPTAHIRYTNPNSGAQVTETGSSSLTLVEPDLEVSLTFFESAILPAGQTFVTLSVSHTAASTGHAYNINLLNDLPLGIQLVPSSITAECEELFAASPNVQLGTLSAQWDSIPRGTTCEFVYVVQALDGLPPCVAVENCAVLTWSSAYLPALSALNIGPANPLGVQRNGNLNHVGGSLNNYTASSCASVEVIIPNLSTPQITGAAQVCAGGTHTLTVQQFNGAFVEYTWYKDGQALTNNSHQLIINPATPQQSGVYAVNVQVGQCNTSTSSDFTLTVHTNPVVSLQDHVFQCVSGSDPVQLSAEISGAGGPLTYAWTGPSFFSSQQVASIPNATQAQSGVYSLTVTDDNGCVSSSASALVTITSAPQTPVIASGASVCVGQSFSLTTTSYTGALGYHWQTPTGEVVTTTPTLTISTADTPQSGVYSVWVQLPQCPTALADEVTVTVNTNPELPVFTASEETVCAGSTVTFQTLVQAGQYAWTGPNGFQSGTQSPPAVNNASVLNAGTYQLIVSNGNCVSEPYSLDLVVHPLPSSPAVSSNSPLCAGETLTLSTGATAAAYRWVLSDGSEAITSEPNLSFGGASAAQSGTYTLSVFNGTCWSAPTAASVQVDFIPSEQAYAGANAIACDNGVAMVQAVNDPTLQGFWSAPANDLAFASPNSQASAVTGLAPGESTLAVWSLHNAGCGVYSSDEVTVYASLNPEAEPDFYELVEGEQQVFNVTANDDPGPVTFTLTIVTPPVSGQAQVVEGRHVRYIPENGFAGEDAFVYRICVNACPDMCDTALVKIKVFPFLRIPDILTPNGDGVNDVLFIEGIHRFPANELYIYNRWGREIFAAENYENNWDATWQGKPLPNGTYFYVLNNRATGENLGKGYITVHQ